MTTDEQTQFKRNEELVKREVYTCVTPLVEFILNTGRSVPFDKGFIVPPFDFDDIQHVYSSTECEACGQTIDKHNQETHGTCPDGNDSFQGVPQDIYEWWAVSPWLFEQLKERGEPVIDTFPHLWGRTTTGQAIALGSVITQIQREHKYAQGDEE